jgi:4-hydroxy-tetrahydrodipicolinate synthase
MEPPASGAADGAAGPAPRGPFSGVLAPVLTPFARDLVPDAARLVRHCRWLLAHGCSALAPFGTTSEASSLSVAERTHLLEALVDGGVPPARLMPGTGCCAIPDTVALTRHAVSLGCGGVLVLPPFYYKGVSDEGLFRAFAEVIERVGDDRLRVYLYHIPPVAQVGLSLALLERLLAEYPGIVAGMKDSSGDMGNTRAALERLAPRGFDVFVGSERFLLEGLRGGGVGCITATANVNAAAVDRLFRGWREPGAERLQDEVNAVRAAVEKVPVIPALKAVLAHHSGDAGWERLRPPLAPLSAAQRESLLADLGARGFAMPALP